MGVREVIALCKMHHIPMLHETSFCSCVQSMRFCLESLVLEFGARAAPGPRPLPGAIESIIHAVGVTGAPDLDGVCQ